jgi:hypothetical protein
LAPRFNRKAVLIQHLTLGERRLERRAAGFRDFRVAHVGPVEGLALVQLLQPRIRDLVPGDFQTDQILERHSI